MACASLSQKLSICYETRIKKLPEIQKSRGLNIRKGKERSLEELSLRKQDWLFEIKDLKMLPNLSIKDRSIILKRTIGGLEDLPSEAKWTHAFNH